MSTAQVSHPILRASMASLAGRMLSNLSIPMREELCRHAAASVLRLRAALEALFVNRFGDQPSFERLRFLFFVAPWCGAW